MNDIPRHPIVAAGGHDLVRGPNGGTFRRRRPEPREVALDGVRWVCARVNPQRVFAVADDLQAVGFRVFCPHGIRVHKFARQGIKNRRMVRERDYPVFGAYVFVGEPAGIFLSKHSHWHVLDVLTTAGGRYVPEAFIRDACDVWRGGKWDERTRPNPFKKGDIVRLTDDVFDGLVATVEKLPNETKAIIRFALFGKPQHQKVDIARLALL